MSKSIIPKKIRKRIRNNPYTAGIGTALIALGGIAALGMRNPQLRERTRELKDDLMRRLSPGGARPEQEGAALASASQP